MSVAVQQHPLQLETAYGVCRHITRSSARNFYYGFLALPRRKRNALSAVYAFMRHADDLSDDASLSIPERRRKLGEWLDQFHRAVEGAPTDDPVFMALRDAQQKYGIPTELLDKLVQGTAMDLYSNIPGDPSPAELAQESPDTVHIAYRTFAELYDYCYHVASVVGLTCIRIFGYREPFAEQLAEEVGVAFQLTNILRDVKEDGSLGRVYIPQEDLDQFGISPQELVSGANLERLRPLLGMEANRAAEFYKAADKLLPLIDEDSQGALWTLVTIYHRLLDRIVERQYDVYSRRVRLSGIEKSVILLKGFLKRLT
ncbi:MAG TPA: phytoene/squalene synthase family protein [Terriglobales bacterium]|nr:phytoene/squalene synthase family protein [Terriglobales bacterium]